MQRRPPSRPSCILRLAALALIASAAPVGAESALVLPLPARFGDIPASTYDRDTGKWVGSSLIRLERTENGQVRMEGRTGIEGGASTRVVAELAPTSDGRGLRLLRQESRSVDPAGHPLGVLEVDHVAGEGRCTGPGSNGSAPEPQTIPLGKGDRVANVPLNLLFQPMVRGETRELRFQILLCSGGRPRIVTAVARLAKTAAARPDGASLVRIQYELALPKLLANMVKRWLPQLSFWFDPNDQGAWIGHEMPLYSKGPNVLVIREDFTPALLRATP